uniref:Uncharacterized protein n=1 Tax=Arundo donax TaxID=35708 RepID=A0A0A9A122_ARUDO
MLWFRQELVYIQLGECHTSSCFNISRTFLT